MAQIRLDKYLSDSYPGSRSESRALIRAGRVCVDGAVVRRPEQKLDTSSSVTVDGRQISYRSFLYLMLDKPVGLITATEDSSRETVLDLLPEELRSKGLFPVGRLDRDTSGLLILTNDGEFAHRVMSPKSGVEKRYLAVVDGVPDEEDAAAFRDGLVLGDGTRCMPAELQLSGGSECIVTVREGKYHQVKRMLAARGKPVLRLRRLSIGGLALDPTLGPGGFRELNEQELCRVFIVR